MLVIAKFLAKILTILNSEISPRQIAAGFAWGVLIGLLPVNGLLPYCLLILALIVNVNLASLFLAAAVFKIFSYAIDPVANFLGYGLLTISSLRGFWTALINTPVLPYTRFNNTLVMGSFLVGLILLVPVYFIIKSFVLNYRSRYREKILKWKVVQAFKASTFYRFYEMYQGIKGE